MAVDQAQMQNISSFFMPVESVNPCLILIVRRENIVGDTMEVLRKSKNVDYKKPLKVKDAKIIHLSLSLSNYDFYWPTIDAIYVFVCVICRSTQVIFVGEEAVDAGGVRKEFFLLIMKELMDPKYGMFRYYEESRLIWFSNKVHGV